MKYKIAHIDESDQAINQFYHNFKADFDIVKIKIDSTSEVNAIIHKTIESKVDAVVVDYLLIEEGEVSFNGNVLFDEFKRVRPYLPIVMLTSHEPEAIDHMKNVHIIYSKDLMDGESSEELELLKTKIKSSITNYYSFIEETKTQIEKLISKKNDEGLNLPEEEELTKKFMIMDDLEPESKGAPSNLIQPSAITALTDLVAQTREILKELKKGDK
jgi:DNA-binding LytR/AlgR family response regulator